MLHRTLWLWFAAWLGCLPSCLTQRLWDANLRASSAQTADLAVVASDGHLHVDYGARCILVELELDRRDRLPCRLEAIDGFAAAFDRTLQAAPTATCALHIRDLLRADGAPEQRRALLVAEVAGEPMRCVPLLVHVESRATWPPHATAVPLHAVHWTTAHHAPPTTDTFGITWRVLATPAALTADAAMLIPLACACSVVGPVVFVYQLLASLD